MNLTEDKKQHLDFIQNIITRMNTNSFQIKATTVTIISALLAVFASNNNVLFIFIGIVTTVIFWFLDAYYLQQERKLRGVYKDVSGITSLNTVLPYEMPIQKYQKGSFSFFSSFKSKTVLWIYLPMILMLGAFGIIILKRNVC